MQKLTPGINEVISNADYHGDYNYLSSSAFKLMLKSATKFKEKYIDRVAEEQEAQDYFAEGSLVHAMILEPEVIEQEFAFFPGFRKAGKEFQAFKAENRDKDIISASQLKRCEKMVEHYKSNDAAVKLIAQGLSEHTMTADFMGIKSKARADWINVEKGYIADLKTTAWASDLDTFRDTIARYEYDLSAALYMEVAKQCYGKDFDFYFIVLSKKEPTCDVFKLSKKSHNRGRDNLLKAGAKYKKCLETGIWVDEQDIIRNEINNSEYEILEV